ncbi:MAG: biopolymer transporter ExbD [Chlamydiota bacterium]|nr:biopolymer transporter ExbD [Chlamydiota bacterium]
MRRVRRSFASEGGLPTINMTPLIDVVFVILIAFVLVAPAFREDRVHLAKGGGHEHRLAEEGLALYLQADGRMVMEGRELTWEMLRHRLIQHEGIIALYCDQSVPFGTYQKVKSTLQDSGIRDMQVILSHGG